MTLGITKSKDIKYYLDLFKQSYGKAHFYFAAHAAFPLALTQDLLYGIWANFQYDIHGNALYIPWISVKDLLLSNLCTEVGSELYEMKETVRNILLSELKNNPMFGCKRIEELASFLLSYVKNQLDSQDIDIKDFAKAQRWTALAYIRPTEATHELAIALKTACQIDRGDIIRIASVILSLAEPLYEYESLLIYARGITEFVNGNPEKAVEQFKKLKAKQDVVKILNVNIPIPPEIKDCISVKPHISYMKEVLSKISAKISYTYLSLNETQRFIWFLTFLFIFFDLIILIFFGRYFSFKQKAIIPLVPILAASILCYFLGGISSFLLACGLTKNYSLMKKFFSISINLNPFLIEFYVNMAHCKCCLGNFNDAIEDCDKAIRINPKRSKTCMAYINRSEAYMKLGNFKKGIEDINSALEIIKRKKRMHKILLYTNRGIAYSKLKNYQMASEDFDQALKIDPKNGLIYKARAEARANLGDFQGAIDDCNQALMKIKRIYIGSTYATKGNIKFKTGKYKEALNELFQGERIDPQHVEIKIILSATHIALGEYQKAIEDCNRVISINPESSLAYINRGYAHSLEGDNNQAIEDFNQALKIDPQNVLAYSHRGLSHYKMGDTQAAIKDFDKAIHIAAERPSLFKEKTYFLRSMIYFYMGNIKRALEDITEAIHIDPYEGEFHYFRGIFYYILEDYSSASDCLNQAIRLKAYFVSSNYSMSNAYYYLNDKDKSKEYYDKAKQVESNVNPINLDDEFGYYMRGIAHIITGNYKNALGDLQISESICSKHRNIMVDKLVKKAIEKISMKEQAIESKE